MRNVIKHLACMGFFILAGRASILAEAADPVSVLKSDASYQEKEEACRALSLQRSREAIPALEALLTDEKLSHMARYALEPMPYPEASEALRNALAKTTESLKVGIINSLAFRRDAQAVPELVALLLSDDAQVAQEAARALGTIATPEAGKALMDGLAQSDLPPGQPLALCDGLLRYAETLGMKGDRDQAIVIYDRLLDVPNGPSQVRAAAMRGAVLARKGDEGLPLLEKALRGEDDALFTAGLRISRELVGDDDLTVVLATVLADLPAERKIRLMEVLSYCEGTQAGPAVLAEARAKGGSLEVREAALRSLTRMGYSPALELMAELAWTEEGDLAKIAKSMLSYFPGEKRAAAIKGMLKSKKAQCRLVAVQMIGQGGMEEPVGLLMKTMETDRDGGVRVAALKALEDTAGMGEFQGILDHMIETHSPDEMQAAAEAVGSISARGKQPATGEVIIQKAAYGALPDGPAADVTEKVAQIAKSGAMSVEASNGNFGDPAPGIVKQLRVDYTENGTPVSKTVQEGGSLNLTTVTAQPALVDALCAAFERAQRESLPAALPLLRLLGSTGSLKALEIVRTVASQGEAETRETAVRVLCEWPTADALPLVMELAQNSSDETLKMLAFRGAVRLLKQIEVGSTDRLQQVAVLMDHAVSGDEKKLVLSGLASLPHPEALEMALGQLADENVKAEAIQAASAIAQGMSKSAKEDNSLCNGKDLNGWNATTPYWRFEDGAIVGHSADPIPETAYLWSDVEVDDFYLSVDVKIEPPTANSGIQFRSKKINEAGHALGYQGDIGQDVWGRLYHQGGRGKLDWSDRADSAVKPGEWNRYEILAVGPAIWTAVNGKLGVACLDLGAKDERSGGIALQIHVGPPQTVRFRIGKLVRHPPVELAGMTAEALIAELKAP